LGLQIPGPKSAPADVHLREIAEALKEGIREAGGTPMEFNTITIHDGITAWAHRA